MISEIQDEIITKLQGILGVKTVDEWQGEIDSLLEKPQRLPSLHVIYRGVVFEEAGTFSPDRVYSNMEFLIVLIGKNLKSRAAGAENCYTIIEGVRAALIGHEIADYDGMLWPIREELIMAAGGVMAYGLTYRMDTQETIA